MLTRGRTDLLLLDVWWRPLDVSISMIDKRAYAQTSTGIHRHTDTYIDTHTYITHRHTYAYIDLDKHRKEAYIDRH